MRPPGHGGGGILIDWTQQVPHGDGIPQGRMFSVDNVDGRHGRRGDTEAWGEIKWLAVA